MRRPVLTVIAAGALSACSIVPLYPPPTQKAMDGGYQAVAELVAKTDLAEYQTPASYASAVPLYTKALANVQTVRTWVEGRAKDKKPGRQAARDLLRYITDCQTLIRTMADAHKTTGLTPGQRWGQVQVGCAVPFQFITK